MQYWFKTITANDPPGTRPPTYRVSHYFAGAPFPAAWQAAHNGQLFPLLCSAAQCRSVNQMAAGDRIVLFQRVRGVRRVVTHLLEVGHTPTYAHGLPVAGWDFARDCLLLARLDPAVFGNGGQTNGGQLVAPVAPHAALKLDALLAPACMNGINVQQGYVFAAYNAFALAPALVNALVTPGVNGFI